MKRNRQDKSDDLVDQNLRKAFQEISNEELPDRFKDLLDRLKSGEDVDVSSQGNTE